MNIAYERYFSQVFVNDFHCTLELKLRSFQMKLNHRAVVTNVQLHGFGLVDSSLCSFCDLHPDTLLHALILFL